MADMMNMDNPTMCTWCKVRPRIENSAVCVVCGDLMKATAQLDPESATDRYPRDLFKELAAQKAVSTIDDKVQRAIADAVYWMKRYHTLLVQIEVIVNTSQNPDDCRQRLGRVYVAAKREDELIAPPSRQEVSEPTTR